MVIGEVEGTAEEEVVGEDEGCECEGRGRIAKEAGEMGCDED